MLQIEKQFGKGSVMRMGVDGLADPVQAISTGSLALDSALGIGGCRAAAWWWRSTAPRPRARRPWPWTSSPRPSGTGGIAAFVDAEHALDVTYARTSGSTPTSC